MTASLKSQQLKQLRAIRLQQLLSQQEFVRSLIALHDSVQNDLFNLQPMQEPARTIFYMDLIINETGAKIPAA
jgi:hypothetical protein